MPNKAFQTFLRTKSVLYTSPFKTPGVRPAPPQVDIEKVGIMVHKKGSDVWWIDKMPYLAQGAAALVAPLDKALSAIPASKMPIQTDAAGAPILINGKPHRYTYEELRNDLMGYGCYTTSLCVMMQTALANRASDLKTKPINRTKIFDELGPAAGGTKAITQLVWMYMEFVKYMQTRTEAKQEDKVQPFFMFEAVADMGNGLIKEPGDPYSADRSLHIISLKNGDANAFSRWYPFELQPTHDRIIDLMKNGTVPILGFQRYDIHVAAGKPFHYTFTEDNAPHKVAFAGYQSGKYPMRMLDVGGGTIRNARISFNIDEMKFDATGVKKGMAKYDPDFAQRPYLVYEDEDEIGIKKDGTKRYIQFLEFYEGIFIRSGKPSVLKPIVIKDLEKEDLHVDPLDLVSKKPLKKDLGIQQKIKPQQK